MDCQMPEPDGYEATKIIRQKEQSAVVSAGPRRVPIIALTAHAMQGDREVCITAGMDDYLTKPFSKDKLTAVLKRWIRGENMIGDIATEGGNGRQEAAEPVCAGQDTANRPAVDRSVLDGIRTLQKKGGVDVIGKIVTIFLKDAPLRVAELRRALASGDAPSVRKEAHTLKSSSANMGALGLSALCKDLEALGRDGRLDEASKTFPRLEEEYARVEAFLKEELGDKSAVGTELCVADSRRGS
jgi:CheY-like chemotaxis protein